MTAGVLFFVYFNKRNDDDEATAGKGLAQGPYVAARAGVEPTTLWLKVIVSIKAPPRPTKLCRTVKFDYCKIRTYTST